MNKYFVIGSLASCALLVFGAYAESTNPHESHIHEKLVDGKKLQVDPNQFEKFVKGLSQSQIAIVSVKGMVCDFCARGIEKTFRKDTTIKKIDVDLSQGKVILAYSMNKEIVREEISHNILINGQNMTDLQVITIN
tara:strand:+ start:830 stop:1237 length:408 start_codon:yes stop_codon:yes gene_type:complete